MLVDPSTLSAGSNLSKTLTYASQSAPSSGVTKPSIGTSRDLTGEPVTTATFRFELSPERLEIQGLSWTRRTNSVVAFYEEKFLGADVELTEDSPIRSVEDLKRYLAMMLREFNAFEVKVPVQQRKVLAGKAAIQEVLDTQEHLANLYQRKTVEVEVIGGEDLEAEGLSIDDALSSLDHH